MSKFVLDSDTLTLLGRGHPVVVQNAATHSITDLAITVISLDEMLSGWYMMLRRAATYAQLELAYDRLANIVEDIAPFSIMRFMVAAIVRFESLLRLKLPIGNNDLRIAALLWKRTGRW